MAVFNDAVAQHGVGLQCHTAGAVLHIAAADKESVVGSLRGSGERHFLQQAGTVPGAVDDGKMSLPVTLRQVVVCSLVADKATVEVHRRKNGEVLVVVAFCHPDVGVVVVQTALLVSAELCLGNAVVCRGPRATIPGGRGVIVDIDSVQ